MTETARKTITDCCGREVIEDHTTFCFCESQCNKIICNTTYNFCGGVVLCIKCGDDTLRTHVNEIGMCKICAKYHMTFEETEFHDKLGAVLNELNGLRDHIIADKHLYKTAAEHRLQYVYMELDHISNICKNQLIRVGRVTREA
jgi:hypothetical protein